MTERIFISYTGITPENLPVYHKDVFYMKSDGSAMLYRSFPGEGGFIRSQIFDLASGSQELERWLGYGFGQETIVEGNDLSTFGRIIDDEFIRIDSAHIIYDNIDTNSNWAADRALIKAGLMLPVEDGPNNFWAPGSIHEDKYLTRGADDYKGGDRELFCFLAGTMIDMWPVDASIRPDTGGLYDKAAVLAKVWRKPIEEISPADWVVSFDKAGNLQPGKVTRTFTNTVKVILDFFGTGVTPGHVYYRPDSKKPYKFEPLIDILRDDGIVQKGDGSLIRAATGCEVDSEDDREFWAFTIYEDKDGNERVRAKKKLRLGTRWMLPDGQHFSMREYMRGIGLELLPDGCVRWKKTGLISIFVWTLSDTLPNPENFVLARSGTTLSDIYKAAEWEGVRPDMPPPMARDGGPVQPLSQAGLTLMPRNTPLAMQDEAYAANDRPTLNRKQRKAEEARRRQREKGKRTNDTLSSVETDRSLHFANVSEEATFGFGRKRCQSSAISAPKSYLAPHAI